MNRFFRNYPCLYVIAADDGSPMIAAAPEGEADNLDVVDDKPSPEEVARVRGFEDGVNPEFSLWIDAIARASHDYPG